jgi:mRNA-degrading endonuclease toxin of MazEF toxin-antitoxin module
MIRQGEFYFADVAGSGRRPVIVVSRDALNRGGYVVVVP